MGFTKFVDQVLSLITGRPRPSSVDAFSNSIASFQDYGVAPISQIGCCCQSRYASADHDDACRLAIHEISPHRLHRALVIAGTGRFYRASTSETANCLFLSGLIRRVADLRWRHHQAVWFLRRTPGHHLDFACHLQVIEIPECLCVLPRDKPWLCITIR